MRKLVLLFIITISFFVTYCFAGDNKAPIFQGATDTECIKFSGVDLTWVESFKTEDYVHYINRPVENAMVCHKREMLLFIIKGLEEVYIILGQEYPDKTQSWQLFEVDINDNDDEFTKRYKEMLLELVNMITEPEMWCM
jgi:hypothetical protein